MPPLLEARRQNGVNTLNGSPTPVFTVHGSNKSAPLQECASTPSALSADFSARVAGNGEELVAIPIDRGRAGL